MEKQQNEGARYIELVGKDNKPQAMLIGYSREWSKNITDRWRQRPQEAPRGNLNAKVIDHLSKAIPLIPAYLQNGCLFQVVGTPALVEGLKSGTYTLMQSGGASLGTVVSASSHKIVGQLRFAASSMAPIVAPFVAWSILNGIAGTIQLQRINKKLDEMMRKIERLEVRQEAEVIGRVLQATKTLEDLLTEYSHTGIFTSLMMQRLAIVEQEVGSVLERNRILIDRFAEQAKASRQNRGKHGAEQIATLLREEGPTVIHDMQLLVGLMGSQSRLHEAYLYYALQENPNDVNRRMEDIEIRNEEFQTVISGFPSITELRSHAERCLEEMNWFEKNLFNRTTKQQVQQLSNIQDPFAPQKSSALAVVPSYCFWQDEDGLNIRINR
ncbi:hypothetical protein WA1_50220 [Scytonema hofmannii PCC 7110]|uniref:Uncharacterized protein n=1 Tax=Scytonema hofmannii PCC 7110 TaxID=128403 RepID=A0A139WR47_9CYAN|nr:hypothetical protein [Scytonema hofmannii]KYC34903.1 hypothetical protein WA1_50220 [Scytonema hofmannii PCC 7110]